MQGVGSAGLRAVSLQQIVGPKQTGTLISGRAPSMASLPQMHYLFPSMYLVPLP